MVAVEEINIEQQKTERLRENARYVFNHWRTRDGWAPSDIQEAREMIGKAREMGGRFLADCEIFYETVAQRIRKELHDF